MSELKIKIELNFNENWDAELNAEIRLDDEFIDEHFLIVKEEGLEDFEGINDLIGRLKIDTMLNKHSDKLKNFGA